MLAPRFSLLFTTTQQQHDQMVSHYRHCPLDRSKDEVRLLRVDGHVPARFSLVTVGLANAPPYRALSYTWGLECPAHDLILETPTNAILSVWQNLYDFLDD
jgi:hypothetical protein